MTIVFTIHFLYTSYTQMMYTWCITSVFKKSVDMCTIWSQFVANKISF